MKTASEPLNFTGAIYIPLYEKRGSLAWRSMVKAFTLPQLFAHFLWEDVAWATIAPSHTRQDFHKLVTMELSQASDNGANHLLIRFLFSCLCFWQSHWRRRGWKADRLFIAHNPLSGDLIYYCMKHNVSKRKFIHLYDSFDPCRYRWRSLPLLFMPFFFWSLPIPSVSPLFVNGFLGNCMIRTHNKSKDEEAKYSQ